MFLYRFHSSRSHLCCGTSDKAGFEGDVYTVVNYMFEDDVNIVELCFWTVDTVDEHAAVDEIISTLKKN